MSGAVYLNAQPGSFVGGGIGAEEAIWTQGVEGLFSTSRNFDQGITVTFDDGNFWNIDFAASTFDPTTNTNNGNDLTRPGLRFSGNGRGNNMLGGWFNVLDVEFAKNGDVLRFAVDFRQFDESEDMTGPSTYGSLRINSRIPVNVARINKNIVIDFEAIGLWTWTNDGGWLKLNNNSPDQVAVADMDGNGADDVIAVFSSGIFVKRKLGAWTQLHNFVPELMAVGELDNTGQDDLVVDFGGIATQRLINERHDRLSY